MSKNKKDLTRIEDLDEFIHELDNNDSFEVDSNEEIVTELEPEAPTFDSSFETSFESPSESSFEATSETQFGGTNSFESTGSFSEPLSEGTSFFEVASPSSSEYEFVTEVDEETSQAEADPFDEPYTEPVSEYTPSEPVEVYKAPENFQDLKKFAENSSFTGMGAEGNPSFSVLIKNVRFIEDVNDIVTMMKELSLISDTEEQMKSRLMRGTLLVPRISEFAAILLAHKLRRFDVDIQVGLSDEIHPPKHLEAPEIGLASKSSLYQNQAHSFHFDDPKMDISQIIVAATPGLEGYQVVKYLGVASEHKMLDGHVVQDEDSEEIPQHYRELALRLKAHALKAHSNAVVGLNYQLTPLPSEYGATSSKYRLTCTGNLVWVNKL